MSPCIHCGKTDPDACCRQLATVTAERDGACEGKGNLWVQLEAERAAHAVTRKALQAAEARR